MRSETFGRLLKVGIGSIATGEGKTQPAIEDELGQQIGVTGASIQRYKAGHLPPELRTIEILAEAAVKRGYLNREWLQNFLHAAHYPAPERLLDKLCPPGPVRQRPPRIYENLPAPTYSQFVMRPQVFAEVAEGLAKRSATVLIVGFGGNGKTSLAREIAARCLTGDDVVPQFDAVVWVSDKDRPGTTNLSMVLDEIARTLDYPGFTQFEHQEKRREVEQLLRRQRVLVVIDNFETITDGALLSWLLNLPEPSKALITTREYRREFRRGGWPVDLRGMTEDEARELIAERVKVLKIEKLVGDLTQLEPLLAATGGNPKAIEMMMGLLKYERRPLQEVVDDLYAARGALFDDLFARAWALLDEGARRVLLVATFFPANACAAALSATADVQGYALERAAERLSDLALIDVQQEDLTTIPRYALHPLVRAFARAELEKQLGFEVGARERWVRWYSQRVSEVGYCWNDISKLDLLELEHETVFAVTQWCFERSWLSTVIQLVKNAGYFFHVRGYWGKIESMLFMGADAAFRSQDYPSETLLLAYRVQLYCREGKIDEASSLIPRVRELMEFEDVPEEYRYEACVALSFYWNRTKNP